MVMHSLLALSPGHFDFWGLEGGEVVVVLDILTSEVFFILHRRAVDLVVVPPFNISAVSLFYRGLQVLFGPSS